MSQEQILPINGVRLWTAIQGAGKPMVLCHGGPGGYDYLSPIADTVSDLCQVVRYDQRGSGRSQVIGPYNVSTFIDDLEELRKHFNFERWIVGGHSWGAGLALAYAVRLPARTIAVLHIAGTGIDPRWHDEYRENRLNALSEAEREEYQRLRSQREHAEGADEEWILDRLRALSNKTDVFDPNQVDNLPSFDEYPVSNEVNEKVGADWKNYTADPKFQQSVYDLSMPVLFLHGACDPRPCHFIETLAAKLPRGTFVSIPKSGHYPWIEKPDEVKAALRQFVVDFTIMEVGDSMLIRGEDSAIDLPSTLTEEEKWHYDLFGYLVLRQVISPAEVERMLEIANGWFANPEAAPEPVNVTQDEYSGVLNNVQYGDRIFERLSLNERVMRIVVGLMWNRPRLFNCALVLQKQRPIPEGEKEKLHRDTSGFDFPDGFHNPHNDYQAGNGQIYSNYVNTAITLVDVPEDNGFMCIPGTHKSRIKFPTTIDIDNELAPAITFELKAGDCLIFSSRLMHGAKFWKVHYPRRVVFNRYQFSFYFNENYNLPIEAHRYCISDDQYELESIQRSEKGFAKRILKKLENGEELC